MAGDAGGSNLRWAALMYENSAPVWRKAARLEPVFERYADTRWWLNIGRTMLFSHATRGRKGDLGSQVCADGSFTRSNQADPRRDGTSIKWHPYRRNAGVKRGKKRQTARVFRAMLNSTGVPAFSLEDWVYAARKGFTDCVGRFETRRGYVQQCRLQFEPGYRG